MSKEIKQGYRIPAPLLTLKNNQEYPVADMEDIAGGYHVVKKLDEMYSIPRLHRRVGMLCYVINDDDEYRLIANSATNKSSAINWMKIVHTSSGGDGGGGSIDLSNYVTKAMIAPIQSAIEGLPDFSTLATKTDLQTYRNSILNTVDIKLSEKASINDIPDVSEFLKEAQAQALIDANNAKDDVTQAEINALFT
jgi:hypothetical protein